MITMPITVQYRHIHLSKEDLEVLFGKGAELTPATTIDQRGQVVYEESVEVIGKNKAVLGLKILGPCREETQIELGPTEAFALGLKAPVRISGDIARTASAKVRGPEGEIKCTSCVIIPARHIHLNQKEAKNVELSHGDVVSVSPVHRPDHVIEQVVVRTHPTFKSAFHLTTDEASDLWLQTGDQVTIL